MHCLTGHVHNSALPHRPHPHSHRMRPWQVFVYCLCTIKVIIYCFQNMLEVAVDSLESAVNAIKGGADELELCSYLSDGGLTPTAGLVKRVQRLVVI